MVFIAKCRLDSAPLLMRERRNQDSQQGYLTSQRVHNIRQNLADICVWQTTAAVNTSYSSIHCGTDVESNVVSNVQVASCIKLSQTQSKQAESYNGAQRNTKTKKQ